MWSRGKKLGKGAFATVYLATLPHNLPYSVQAVKSSLVSKSGTLLEERRLLGKFQDCPYIIRCFGSDVTTENGEVLYNLFLEYASGGTLFDRIKSKGMPECEVKRYAESILAGLDYIHKKGYVHCDIKPENILLVEKESSWSDLCGKKGCELMTKIADFGLAKRAGKELQKNESEIRGTPMYLAPESFLRGNYEPKVDIWAFGCTVLQMLTGKTPWDRKAEPGVILFQLGYGEQIPEIPDWVSREARDFLDKCLVRDPESRWSADMLLKHPFVSSTINQATTNTKIGENQEEETKDNSLMCGSYECLSLHVATLCPVKRKRREMIAKEKIDFGENWLGLQCHVKRNRVIPSANTRIEILE